MMAAIVETAQLAKVVLYSLLAGVGISAAFGLGVSGAAGFMDALREHRTTAALAWGSVVTVCVAVAVSAIVFGIVVMTTK